MTRVPVSNISFSESTPQSDDAEGYEALEFVEPELTELETLFHDAINIPMHVVADMDHTIHDFDIADYKPVEIFSKEQALKLTKHCGWCTGEQGNNHYEQTYSNGRLFVFYKPSKKRPSYQLYISGKGSVEFRKKGNKLVDPWDFAEANESVKEIMFDLLPDKSKLKSSTVTFEEFFVDRSPENFFEEFRIAMEEQQRELNAAILDIGALSETATNALNGISWISADEYSSIEHRLDHKATSLDRLKQRNKDIESKAELSNPWLDRFKEVSK